MIKNKNDVVTKRFKTILRTSIVGILVNALLGVFKAIVGTVSNSIAITMDAVNNFTDAGSSLITILSTTFSVKAPNKKHPFGYGRIEYMGTLLIAILILYAGVTSLIESIKGIITPETAEYSTVSIIIICIAVVVKIGLAIFFSKVGRKVKSDSLIATGKEAIGDIAISVATVVAVVIYIFTGFSIEAWLGAAIAGFIIKSGVEILIETIGKILGKGADVEIVKNIKKEIASFDEVDGAFDLVLHNYGPDTYMGSIHVEVSDTLSINEFDALTRRIQERVFEKFGIFITAVGVYSVNTTDEKVIETRESVKELVSNIEHVKQIHGFYLDDKTMRFDAVISFAARDRRAVYDQVVEQVGEKYPEYKLVVGFDMDFNEI